MKHFHQTGIFTSLPFLIKQFIAFYDSPKTSATTALLLTLIAGLLRERGLAWLQRNPSFLYLSPYPPPPARFLFFFKLQNLPQKKHGMIHPLVCSPRSSFSYWANPLMGSWIWTRQQRCWRCKREGFMTSPTSWKASTSLRRSLKTTCSGCEYGSPPHTLQFAGSGLGLGVGFFANCSGVSPSPSFHSHAHTFFSFLFSPTLFFSLLSPLFPPQFLSLKFKVSLQRDLLFRWCHR